MKNVDCRKKRPENRRNKDQEGSKAVGNETSTQKKIQNRGTGETAQRYIWTQRNKQPADSRIIPAAWQKYQREG